MKHLIFDSISRRCVGTIEGDCASFNGDGILVDAGDIPDDVPTGDLSGLYLGDDGVTIAYDTTAFLVQAKSARKARIKSEARALIEALDWRLERARERAEAGVSGVESVADVLAQREAIRRSSSAAEDAVDALTDVASVVAFAWSVTRDEDGGA